MSIQTLSWKGGTAGWLELIDQRLLPERVEILCCKTPSELFEAIKTLAVRGAPAIGVAGAYGICLAVRSLTNRSVSKALDIVRDNCGYLSSSRPTAVNLFWALDRMQKTAADFIAVNPDRSLEAFKKVLLDQAHTICDEDKQMCEAIGVNGESLIPDGGAVLTHCNAGALATAGIGTALAPMYVAYKNGKRFRVYVDETRPLLQGSRLTAWELTRAKIDTVLICDNMAASLMQAGKIDAVITGADRIAANGDAANKIGTLGVSILAKHYGIPFYIAAPSSTFDLAVPSGEQIPIELRGSEEVCGFGNRLTAPQEVEVYNPAFDVTPAGHIAAIITERGLIRQPDREKISTHLSD
ncbi:MAG: S-methyl-5-thioribose-1-phosphate isomerase [Planctomycetota bacterium]|jgi:methylthioribose-1-phosphate isomerase